MTPLPRRELAVDELRDRAALSALAQPWEQLRARQAAQGGVRGPFLSLPWFAVWAASLTGDGARRLRVLVAHQDGRVVGILPLLCERRRLAGLPARVLRSLSDDHSQRFDPLIESPAAAEALLQHLAQDPAWDVLELRETLDDGQAAAGLSRASGAELLTRAAARARLSIERWQAQRSPYLPLPSRPEELELGLRTKFRANLRRRARKLSAELGPIELERVPCDLAHAELALILDEGLALEAAGWKGASGTAIACDPGLRRRYHALAHAFAARGELALRFLRVGGRRVAFHFALLQDQVYYLLKPGSAPELAVHGLGHQLVYQVAQELIPAGVRELDFLGEDVPWKREWTDRVRPHLWRYFFRPSGRSAAIRAWKFRCLPSLRRALGRLGGEGRA